MCTHEEERRRAIRRQQLKNSMRSRLRRMLVFARANHIAAVVMLRAHDALASRSIWPRGALQTLKEQLERVPGSLFRFAGYLDDKAPCPNCGRPEALIHLATLKTYCWDCSYWGQDPRDFADAVEREKRDLDRHEEPEQT